MKALLELFVLIATPAAFFALLVVAQVMVHP